MSSLVRPLFPTDDDRLYPSSDGAPVGETDWHIWALILLREALEDFFAAQDDVYIASDLFWYYRKGDPGACKAPDVMVVPGVAKRWRRTFQTWVEKAVPSVIVEITSENTWPEDLGEKRALYEQLGVREYFVFDPEALFLEPPLQGFRRKGKRDVALAPSADGSLPSRELGLLLRAEGPMVRLRDARTGELILTRTESKEQAQRRAEQERTEKERERQRAEQERTEKERERQRAEQERTEKERERQRAEQERTEKEHERQRADALEAELARLKAAQAKRPRKKRRS